MIKTLLVWVACLLLITTNAQDSKEALKQFNTYSRLVLDRQFDKALDYVNDGVFEIAPRAQMKAVLEQTFNNKMMEFEMSMPEILGVSATTKIENTYYLKFLSKNIVKMRFSPEAIGESEAATNQVKQGLAAQFGEANVSYDVATRFFSVIAEKPVIATSIDKQTWKFVTIDNEQLIPMLEKFIPKEILEMKVD